MKKTILNSLPKLLFVVLILLGTSALNTCNAPDNNTKKNEISFSRDKFYFSKYIKYKMESGERSIHAIHRDNGSIEIYGDVVRIKRTGYDKIYNINERFYNEIEQVYEFYSDETVLEFDVVNKKLTIYEKDGSGTVYHINSTIKSNW